MTNKSIDDMMSILETPLEDLKKEAGVSEDEAVALFEKGINKGKSVTDITNETSLFIGDALEQVAENLNENERFKLVIEKLLKMGTPVAYNLAKMLLNTNDIDGSDPGFNPTVLNYAVVNKETELIELCIKAGASVTLKNSEGYSAIDLAKQMKDGLVLGTIEYSSAVRVKEIIEKCKESPIYMKKYLNLCLAIDSTKDINVTDVDGRNILYHAVVEGNIDLVKLLLKYGAIKVPDENSIKTSSLAVAKIYKGQYPEDDNRREICNILHGVSVFRSPDGKVL